VIFPILGKLERPLPLPVSISEAMLKTRGERVMAPGGS
jgi:hypothetical protein